MSKYYAGRKRGQKKVTDKPPRQYKLTKAQVAKAEAGYTKGISLSKLQKVVGAARESVRRWMVGRGVTRKAPTGLRLFQQDVRTRMRTEKRAYAGREGALRYTMDTPYWYDKRMARLDKTLKPYMDRFNAGKPETKKQIERRHWLQGKKNSEELKKEWSDYKQGKRPEKPEPGEPGEGEGNYNDWGDAFSE